MKFLASLKRFVVICFILVKQLVLRLRYRRVFAPRRKAATDIDRYLKTREPKQSGPVIARETLQMLGPTFVKFGQFLSVRPDLVSVELCNELRKLQDNVPPFPFAEARAELERELQKDPGEVFSEFNEVPVAAASVAQVYRARLRSGEEVAVKIQRPRVRDEMEEDILIMLFFAHLLDRLVPSLRKNQLVMLVHEFSRWTDRELDFSQEARHALHFSACFADYAGITIPRVFPAITTERVLVMEFIRGVNPLQAAPGSYDGKAVARLVADSMLKQMFVDGFFHGDPHAGNILLTGRDSIAYLDFGIVGYLSEELREWTFDIVYGMSTGDVTRVIESFLELCEVDTDKVNVGEYRRRMNEVLAELRVCEAARIPFTHMLERFLNTSLEFGLDVPHEFVMMSKAITTLEGTCMCLDPELRIVGYLQPFVQKHIKTAPDFDTALQQLKNGPFEIRKLQRLVTKHGARILRNLERPTFRVEGEEFVRIVRELEKSSENIAYGLLIAALVVFSATVSNESKFEIWLQATLHLPILPILSLGSLALAAYLWVRLFLRNRQRKKDRRRAAS